MRHAIIFPVDLSVRDVNGLVKTRARDSQWVEAVKVLPGDEVYLFDAEVSSKGIVGVVEDNDVDFVHGVIWFWLRPLDVLVDWV